MQNLHPVLYQQRSPVEPYIFIKAWMFQLDGPQSSVLDAYTDRRGLSATLSI